MSDITPFSANASASFTRTDHNIKFDLDVFPRETNKITKERWSKNKYLVKCDGKGNMSFELLKDPIKQIERLAKLRDQGLLTDEEFDEQKKKLMNKI